MTAITLRNEDDSLSAVTLDRDYKLLAGPVPDVEALTMTRESTTASVMPEKYTVLATRSPAVPDVWLVLDEQGLFSAPQFAVGVRPMAVMWRNRGASSTGWRAKVDAGWLVAFDSPEGVAWGYLTHDAKVNSGPLWKQVELVAGPELEKRFQSKEARYLIGQDFDGKWQAFDPVKTPAPLHDEPVATQAEALRLAELRSAELVKQANAAAARHKRHVEEMAQRCRASRTRLFSRYVAQKRALWNKPAAVSQVSRGRSTRPDSWATGRGSSFPIRSYSGSELSSGDRSARIRAYTNALNDWTYGRSSWRPVGY